MQIEFQGYQLRVLSAISSNISAGFILLTLASSDRLVLTGDIFFAMLSMLAAFKLEKLIEDIYDQF